MPHDPLGLIGTPIGALVGFLYIALYAAIQIIKKENWATWKKLLMIFSLALFCSAVAFVALPVGLAGRTDRTAVAVHDRASCKRPMNQRLKTPHEAKPSSGREPDVGGRSLRAPDLCPSSHAARGTA